MELIRSGKSANAAAREFEISRQTITNWLKRDDLDVGRRTDGLTSEEQAELTRLRRENKRLRLEQEILSKAVAFFMMSRSSRNVAHSRRNLRISSSCEVNLPFPGNALFT